MLLAAWLAAAGDGCGCSSSLSGCSISRLFACACGSVKDSGSEILGVAAGVESGVNSSLNADLGSSFWVASGAGVAMTAGADLDLVGSLGVAAGAGAGAGAEEGAAAIGSFDEEVTALVSRSIIFGRADLPAKKSEADMAGSADTAGGKILVHTMVSSSDPRTYDRERRCLLRLEALGFTRDNVADGLDGRAVQLESTGDLVLLDIERTTGQEGHTAFFTSVSRCLDLRISKEETYGGRKTCTR